ncbi:MAG: DUF1499 domain-containing protein [Gammaproteobacteria bacterium]|nr:DUF1499 domain-containing protein [Gammaproteobacteria bacterium]
MLKSTRTWGLVAVAVAVVLLAATVYAIVGARTGAVGFREAFGMLRWVARIGAAALLLSAGVLAATFLFRDRSGRWLSLAALVLLLIPVGGIVLNAQSPPPGTPINDITTDLEDPPRFDAVIPLRPAGSNPVEYGGAAVAARQREAHPEVRPIESQLAPAEAFDRALEVARDMGWEIVADDRASGIIEAVDTTTFFRFKDDIVVRVRPANGGSRIDLRSLSRVGRSDLGKNAARIVEFTQSFERG